MNENSIYCYLADDEAWFAPRMWFASDAKAFAKVLWATGAFRRVAVVGKSERVTWAKGPKEEGDEA